MKKFLIPLATALAALLPHSNTSATIAPAINVFSSTRTSIEPTASLHRLDTIVAEPVAPLVLAKKSANVERVGHRSHQSHASHRSHRSGR